MPNTKDNAIKCPACNQGYLALMTKAEIKRLERKEKMKIGHKILGCDECKHWEEAV